MLLDFTDECLDLPVDTALDVKWFTSLEIAAVFAIAAWIPADKLSSKNTAKVAGVEGSKAGSTTVAA